MLSLILFFYHYYLDENEKESTNIKESPEKELCAQIQANGIEIYNSDELRTEIPDDGNEISNEQNENERGKFILIYEPENTEAKHFFPLLEEKLLIGKFENSQKLAEEESEDDEETIDESSDSNKESTSCSDSSEEESEASFDSDNSEEK
uniref:Uncharacterized protein n=1 Tax=Nothoprocta perdicaria TaxID=30464 RepID=A0A8C6YP35_NOTPE